MYIYIVVLKIIHTFDNFCVFVVFLRSIEIKMHFLKFSFGLYMTNT